MNRALAISILIMIMIASLIVRAQPEYVLVSIIVNEAKPYYILFSNSGVYFDASGPYNSSTFNNFQYDQIVIIASQYPFEVRINNETISAKYFPIYGYYYEFIANKSMTLYIDFISSTASSNNFTITTTVPWWAKLNSSNINHVDSTNFSINNIIMLFSILSILIIVITIVALRKRS